MSKIEIKKPTLAETVFLFVFVISMIITGNIYFNIRIEMLMIFATIFAAFLARRRGVYWSDLENTISQKLTKATPAILIVWSVGVVISSFMFSGSIPLVIYYGLKIINPQYLYVCSFLLCAVLSMATGTSWGSAATGGVAMMGIAMGFQLPLHITAASVICGALVGDKLSPLSETTNLAPMACEVYIFDHIKSMLWTTIPASVISLLVFYIAGLGIEITTSDMPQMATMMIKSLDSIYKWNIILLIPFAILVISALLKYPPVPTMIGASIVAIIIGGLFQGFNISEGFSACITGFKVSVIHSGEVTPSLLKLLNRGGMRSMSGIVVLIYCGYAFASIISRAGYVDSLTKYIINNSKSAVALVASSLFTNFFIAACAGSSYVSFIITGELYRNTFIEHDIDPRVLSRSLEDSGTMMLPLVPWSIAGAFYVQTLGVNLYGPQGYAIWSVNTFMNPVVALILAASGIGMYKLSKEKKKKLLNDDKNPLSQGGPQFVDPV